MANAVLADRLIMDVHEGQGGYECSCDEQTPTDKTKGLPDVLVLGGAVAGLLAGMVMVLLSPILALLTGIGIWKPPKLITSVMHDDTSKRLQATNFLYGSL